MFRIPFNIHDLDICKMRFVSLKSKKVPNLYYHGEYLLDIEKEKISFLVKHHIKIRRKNGRSLMYPDDFIFRVDGIDFFIRKNRFKKGKNNIDDSKLYDVAYSGTHNINFSNSLGKCSLIFPTRKLLARWKLMI